MSEVPSFANHNQWFCKCGKRKKEWDDTMCKKCAEKILFDRMAGENATLRQRVAELEMDILFLSNANVEIKERRDSIEAQFAEIAPYRGMYLRLVKRLKSLKSEFLRLPDHYSGEHFEKRAKIEAIDAAIEAAGKESGDE